MPSCGLRSWWRTTTTSAEDSSAFSVARSATPLARKSSASSSVSTRPSSRQPSTSSAPAAARPPGAQALLEPVEQLALAAALVLLDPARRLGAHLVDARVLDADADVAREPLLQVGMQAALEVADGLVGGADQQVLEALALEQVEDDGGGVGEVVADVLLDRALVAGLRPAALPVLGVDVVLDPVRLVELLGRAGEDAGDPAVGEQHAPEAARERLRERLDVRRGVDHHARLERAPDPHRLEQARGAAGEDGDRARALVGDARLLRAPRGRRRRRRAAPSGRRARGRRRASSTLCCASFITEVIALARAGGVANSEGSRFR